MANLRQTLPNAGALVVFEAAGRLGSFTAAGRELGMSQAAVSYAVARLEEQLGAQLFQREYRRVELTEAGARFHADVSLGLSHIGQSAERLRAARPDGHVTLSASTAFAALWMAPRLQAFREEVPGVELRIQTSDRDIELVGGAIPLGVRGGDPADWPDYDCLPISRELVYPVCSPSYCAQFGEPVQPAELLRHRLIHLDEPYRSAITWAEWFMSAKVNGVLTPKGLHINDYVSVIQSVLAGQGVALGWDHLTGVMVGSGALVKLTGHVHDSGKSFYVVWRRGQDIGARARLVRNWLGSQGPVD